jgi:glucose-1-phosphate thymidylyltransferase
LLGGITDLVAGFESSTAEAQILLTEVAEPQRFGVAVLDEHGRVVELLEKPKNPPSNLAVVGVYMFRSSIHKAVRAIEPSARGELEITDAIEWLIQSGCDVQSHMVTGYWKDTGRLQDMLECNRQVLESIEPSNDGFVDEHSNLVGRVVVEEGARIIRSTVRGPAIIGPGTEVVDSYIGPFTSVYHGCKITNTELEHSIILEDCIITGVSRIEDSLLGKSVTVGVSDQQPRAHRLMLGDNSLVTLP